MLTAKQHKILTFVIDYLSKHNFSPSYHEIREEVGLVSKSSVHRHVSALEERGFIKRLPDKARAIEVLRRPDQHILSESSNENQPDLPPTNPGDSGSVQLPLLGRIAAGTPIEALSDDSTYLSVPQEMVSTGEHFALDVVGDSMIDAGILHGDIVIIKRAGTADSGDIVVALIEEREATLKTLRKQSGRIALEPANANYETRYYESSQIKIQGRLTGLIRRY